MTLTGLSFVAAGIFQLFLDKGIQISVAWQLIPYLILTMAEVMVSITGLEFAYTQAPRAMRSTIMGIWFVIVFLGNMFTGIIAKINIFDGGNFFMFFGLLTILVSGIFIWMAVRYQYRDYVESDDAPARLGGLSVE